MSSPVTRFQIRLHLATFIGHVNLIDGEIMFGCEATEPVSLFAAHQLPEICQRAAGQNGLKQIELISVKAAPADQDDDDGRVPSFDQSMTRWFAPDYDANHPLLRALHTLYQALFFEGDISSEIPDGPWAVTLGHSLHQLISDLNTFGHFALTDRLQVWQVTVNWCREMDVQWFTDRPCEFPLVHPGLTAIQSLLDLVMAYELEVATPTSWPTSSSQEYILTGWPDPTVPVETVETIEASDVDLAELEALF